MRLKTPFWRSATTPDFPLRWLSARAAAYIVIGRWSFSLILKHGKDTPDGSLPLCDSLVFETNEQPTLHPSSARQERTTAKEHPLAEWCRDH
jgi:hypothetical protein